MMSSEEGINDIAIIGMSGRFPGAKNVHELWQVLSQGKVAARQFTNEELRKAGVDEDLINNPDYVKSAYVLENIDQFDASLFELSPKDAATLDPQHRLFLETVWKALESAGYAPDFTNCVTGLFAGSSMSSYYLSQLYNNDNGKSVTNSLQLLLANDKDYLCTRTAYKLNFKGPSINIQTACSTSLVAVSQACDSLLDYQCDLAVAGGVTVRVPHDVGYLYEEGNILSPDGRCKTFDESAEGTVFGNGVAAIVLKRLEDAMEDGDEIYAVIKAASVNNDGSTKIAFSAPAVDGQAEVIAMAQAMAEISPETIDYVECHGTGTSLGDPVEVEALRQVFEAGTDKKHFCALGAVKSNVGHLESAAGITSLIKAVLALKHKKIPPSKHFSKANTQIQLENSPFYINKELLDWHVSSHPRRAGVSSFGMGGTNAHVILEEASLEEREKQAVECERSHHLLTLSGKSEAALAGQVNKYIDYLDTTDEMSLGDISYTSHVGRSHFPHRLGVVGNTKADWMAQLKDYQSKPGSKPDKIAFLYTGQGSQHAGMCRSLYEQEVVFRDSLQASDEVLKSILPHSLIDVLYGEKQSYLTETRYTQPVLFAIELALTALWKSWGVEADYVLGHSLGEYVAACERGVMSEADGLKLVAARGHLMQGLSNKGGMISLLGDESKIQSLIADIKNVEVSAYNGPGNLVVSGEVRALEKAEAIFAEHGIKVRQLNVATGFHSALVEPILDAFGELVARIKLQAPQAGLVSNLTGELIGEEVTEPGYWQSHMRKAVQYRKGLQMLVNAGVKTFIELGPNPVLLGLGRQNVDAEEMQWLPSIREGEENHRTLLTSLSCLYEQGRQIDWEGVDKGYIRHKTSLPTYAFQRQRYWVEQTGAKPIMRQANQGHPLLGEVISLANPGKKAQWFSQIIGPGILGYLYDHRVYGQVVYPAAAYVEMVLSAGEKILQSKNLQIEHLQLHAALILADEKELQTLLTENGPGYQFEIYSKDEDEWLLHASGEINKAGESLKIAESLDSIRKRVNVPHSVEALYEKYKSIGIEYGVNFQTIEELTGTDGESLALISMPLNERANQSAYQLHPALLDGAFQSIAIIFDTDIQKQTYLPVGFRKFLLDSEQEVLKIVVAGKVKQSQENKNIIIADISLFSETGKMFGLIEGLEFKKVDQSIFDENVKPEIDRWHYEIKWKARASRPKEPNPDFIPHVNETADKLVPELEELIVGNKVDQYQVFLHELNKISGDFVIQLFKQLGLDFSKEREFTLEQLVDELAIKPKYHRLLNRFLGILEEEKIVIRSDDYWKLNIREIVVEPDKDINLIIDNYPEYEAETTLLKECGINLKSILRGEIDATEVIFPNGDITAASKLYLDSPVFLTLNSLVKKSIIELLDQLPKGRLLRVLEIGAGTGGTTSHIIDSFSEYNSEYYYTDLSTLFLNNAKEKFGKYSFVHYELLDIEKDPVDQGFYNGQFDLVIAANVLHATRDLTTTLNHVKQLLAPEGLILLVEGTEPQRYVDLIFGLTDGWWHFEDTNLRHNYPLISAGQWQELLINLGYIETATLPDKDKQDHLLSSQVLVMAKAPQPVETTIKTWLVFGKENELTNTVTQQFSNRGDHAIVASTIEQLSGALEQSKNINGIVFLAGINEADLGHKNIQDLMRELTQQFLSTVHAVLSSDHTKHISLYIQSNNGLLHSTLSGLARVINLEHPELACRHINISTDNSVEASNLLVNEIYCEPGESHVSINSDERVIARLSRLQVQDENASDALCFSHDSAYIVTGGLGGLGKLVTQWLIDKGAGVVAIFVRRSASKDEQEWIYQFNGKVQLIECDLADFSSVNQAILYLEKEFGQIKGLIHVAGVLSDGLIEQLDWDNYEDVYEAKVFGAWNLHESLKDKALDHFVLFSSIASILGSIGQSNHAAANSFMDALANWRRSNGAPALSINWGAWAKIGAAASYVKNARDTNGMFSIEPEEGLRVLEQLMLHNKEQVAVFPILWDKIQINPTNKSYFEDLLSDEFAKKKSEFIKLLEANEIKERRDILKGHIKDQVSEVLGVDVTNIQDDQGFFDIGMDSLTSMDLRAKLQRTLSCYLPTTFVFNSPSIEGLVEYLINQVLDMEFSEIKTNDFSEDESDEIDIASYESLSEEEVNALLDKHIEDISA